MKIKNQDVYSATLAQKNTAKQLRDKHGEDFYYEDRSIKSRYVYFIGDRRQRRKLLQAYKRRRGALRSPSR